MILVLDYDAIAVDDILDIHKYLIKKNNMIQKCLGLLKKVFFTGLAFLSSLTTINLMSCISMNNQGCKGRPGIVNLNRDEPAFFPFSIKASKCSDSCNNINNPYAK